MKTSLKHLICCFFLLTFVAACGKKGGSEGGSSSGKNNVSNPVLINPNINQAGVQAYNAVKTWYSGAETNVLGSFGDYLKTSQSVSNGFSGSFNFCFFGMGNCDTLQPNGCYIRNPNGTYRIGTPTVTNGMTTSCNITVQEYAKSSNTELAKAISGNGLSLMHATRSGNVYTLVYGAQNSLVPSVIYTIDTSLHSLLNPVMIQEQSKVTSLKGFRILQH